MTGQPKIVVLDGYALNPGDLDWSGLEAIGECTFYDRTPPEETISRAQGAEIVLTNKTLLARDEIEALPSLKYIGILATGFNTVDLDSANELKITVTNIPTYGTDSVAQMAFALLLSLTQRVDHHARTVREGRWTSCPDFCYWDYPLIELAGLKMGIVGFGRIGRATGKLAQAFGMQVLAYDTIKIPATDGIEVVDLDTLFRNSDVVSLHCPLTPETEKLVNRERLAVMKETAFLINTSRGPLVDGAALAAALKENQIAGAALDVLEIEPPPADNPLLRAKNCLVTPHIAWATRSARRRLLNTAVQNVKAFVAGAPQNVVNG
jgi:glycerate dehydrogenase